MELPVELLYKRKHHNDFYTTFYPASTKAQLMIKFFFKIKKYEQRALSNYILIFFLILQ